MLLNSLRVLHIKQLERELSSELCKTYHRDINVKKRITTDDVPINMKLTENNGFKGDYSKELTLILTAHHSTYSGV